MPTSHCHQCQFNAYLFMMHMISIFASAVFLSLRTFHSMPQVFSYSQLFTFTRNVFISMGCSDTDANTAATCLVAADVRGIDSHGVARLSGYVRLWEAGRIN